VILFYIFDPFTPDDILAWLFNAFGSNFVPHGELDKLNRAYYCLLQLHNMEKRHAHPFGTPDHQRSVKSRVTRSFRERV